MIIVRWQSAQFAALQTSQWKTGGVWDFGRINYPPNKPEPTHVGIEVEGLAFVDNPRWVCAALRRAIDTARIYYGEDAKLVLYQVPVLHINFYLSNSNKQKCIATNNLIRNALKDTSLDYVGSTLYPNWGQVSIWSQWAEFVQTEFNKFVQDCDIAPLPYLRCRYGRGSNKGELIPSTYWQTICNTVRNIWDQCTLFEAQPGECPQQYVAMLASTSGETTEEPSN